MAPEKSQSDAKQRSNMKDIKWGIVAFALRYQTAQARVPLHSPATPIFLLARLLQLFLPLFC